MINFWLWGIIILFIATAIYYIVFLSLIFYWHEKKRSFIIVPVIFAFEFFVIAFLVISLIAIVLSYIPQIIG